MSRCSHGSGIASRHSHFAWTPIKRHTIPRNNGRFASFRSKADEGQDEEVQDVPAHWMRTQLELFSASDVLRRTFLGPQTLQRNRSILQRLEKNQSRSDNWMETIDRPNIFVRLRHIENSADTTVAMDLLRFQYRACSTPEDYMLVYTTAFKHDESARLIASRSMQNMLCRCLESSMDKHKKNNADRIITAVDHFVRRAHARDFEIELPMLLLGLRSAFACWSLSGMKRYLQLVQEHNSKYVQAAEGRIQLEFFDHLLEDLRETRQSPPIVSPEQLRQAMLEITCRSHYLMPQDSAPALSRWLTTLAHWKGADEIWDEWVRNYEASVRNHADPQIRNVQKPELPLWQSSRLFIMYMFRAGDPVRGWRIFEASADLVTQSDEKVWAELFDHADSMPRLRHELHERVKNKFVSKLERKLHSLEHALGLRWVDKGGGPEAHHEFSAPRQFGLLAGSEPPEGDEW